MYKVFPVEGGYQVFRLIPDSPPVPVARPVFVPSDEDGKYAPYKQRQAAYRRCKKLNDDEAVIDAMIARDGAIIL
jgi:hypothetical protein